MGKPSFERHITLMAGGAALPGCGLAAMLLWRANELDPTLRVLLLASSVIVSLWIAWSLVRRIVFPLRTLANLLGGIRDGDFSMRARDAARDDALGEVFLETNALAQTLLEQRFGAMEATALLRTVMAELDVAVFAFDDAARLRLANRAGADLLRRPVEQILGRSARELGLSEALEGEAQRTVAMTFPAGAARFGLRRSSFRQNGRPHQLMVLTDLGRVLREEERAAWQRLLRVLGHEINNSLTPIKSITATLTHLLRHDPLPEDWREDAGKGLAIIHSRSDALARFIDDYSKLAKLPPPRRRAVELADLVSRVASLETRVKVRVEPSPNVRLTVDPDQIEQLLINLVRNAVDAVLSSPAAESSRVSIRWCAEGDQLVLRVEDSGLGVANPANLFVPFFTTKSGGSGIGLTLCRQIAEAHAGGLSLENLSNARGAVATLRLPLKAHLT